jgi:AcrR family transcriptional regulator
MQIEDAARRRSRSSAPTTAARARGESSLTEHDVIGAALALVRRGGVDELSMRALARELDVTPMAIYHYVPNKRALIARVTDSVLGSLPTPEPSGKHWDSELRALALVSWQRMAKYPGLLPDQSSGTNKHVLQYGLSILLAAGFDRAAAQLAITTYHTFMLGVARSYAQQGRAKARSSKKKVPRTNSASEQSYREQVLFAIDAVIARLQQQRRVRGDGGRGRRARLPGSLARPSLYTV